MLKSNEAVWDYRSPPNCRVKRQLMTNNPTRNCILAVVSAVMLVAWLIELTRT